MIYLVVFVAYLFGFFTAAVLASGKYEDKLNEMKYYYEDERKWD